MRIFGTAFLLVLLSITTNAARTNKYSNPCSMECSKEKDNLFKPGQKYTFSYQAESNMKTTNELYDTTGVMIKAKVTVTGLSNCEMKLSMSEVKISDKISKDGKSFRESPNSSKIKSILELNEVFFTRENNEVKSVCFDKDEPIWSENIKKAVIDSLANQGIQTQMLSYKKTSHGKCYIQSSEQNKLATEEISVKFQYDIKSCDNEMMKKSIFGDLSQMAVFENSQVSCQYLYKDSSKLHSVQCIEEYKTSKLKQNDNQLIVEIKTNLNKENQESTDDKKFSNKNLIETGIEQTEDELQSEETNYATVKQTLKEICDQQTSSNLSTIPKLFMKLVNQLKDLDSKEFKEVYLDVLKTDICPGKSSEMSSLFYDASGFVSTPASTSVMVELIKNNRISLFDQNVWLTSLSFMQQTPTLEMLTELETLISVENPNIPTYLGISAVTNLFCKDNYKLCLVDPKINNIVSKFLQNLNNDCSIPKDASKDFSSKIQISLKAIGNLKFYPENVVRILNKCISTSTNELSVKISALEVMKHMDCKTDRTEAMKILLNNENDSELRINAYLTVMGCSDINTLFKVREVLSKEKVNQVGSFIWTHLTNIKESSDILKSKIKELLDDVNFKKEFDISKLKFSRNIEKTFKSSNMSLTVDSNVIFSEKSFIPRSVSLNTITSIFGRTTNFLEMSTRLEGLEEMLFKLFGPEGYMKKKSNAEDNLDLIKMLNGMSGNMNIKLYGQQISFVELIRGSLSSIKKYNIIEEIMNWSQDKTFELNKNLQLVDKTVVLPTLLGFPLEFKLQGSVSMNIKIKSKLDLAGLVSWPISFNIDNYISPNINAELYSDIVMKSPYSNYGIRLNIKSGTNTELKAKIYAKNNEEFSVKFDTIKSKQEIISIEGNTYVIHQNKKIIQLQDKMKSYKWCTSELMVRFFGVKVCSEAKLLDSSIRKNTLILSPFSFNVFIDKIDSQTGYILQAFSKSSSFISSTGNIMTNRNIKFEFNTPNSEIYYRRFYGELEIDYKNKNFKLELVTPWSEALLLAKYGFPEKKLEFNLKVSRQDIIGIVIDHTQQYSSKRKITKGGLSITAFNLTPIKTKWSLDITDDEYLLNLFSKGLTKDDNQLKIKILRVKSTRQLSLFNKYEISGFYNSYLGNGKISGMANENYYGHRWDIKLNHKSKTSKDFQMVFRHKTEDKSSKNLNKFLLTSTFNYGENAENFFTLKTENEFSEKHFRTFLKAGYGQIETKNTKSFEEELSMHLYGGNTWKNDGKHYAEGSLSLKFPKRNINYEGRYNSEIGKRLFKLSLAMDQEQQSKINLKINYDQPKLYLKDTVLDVTFSLPNHNVDVKWNLMEIDVNKFKYTLESKYNNYDMKIDGVQTQISKLDHDSFITIQMPRIASLPKDVKIKLKINLVDLSKAKLQGEIEIPNLNYRYSIDTQFSYTPQNFLQISSSEINSVLRYNIELSNRQKIVKSKFIFTCNPKEFQTLFNINFGKNSNSDDQIEFDIHALQKNPVYKEFNNVGKIAIRYPGNSHSIGFKSEFKYTEMLSQIDIIWNKNQRIAITSTYELDKSWTQKGIVASLTIKTPFIGYEQIHFGINAVGQLRYRKVSFEYKWGMNRKILFDIIIQPRSSSDFSLNAKLITPFSGWNLVNFQAKHIHSPNSINTHCSIEIGPVKRYQVKFDAINNSEGKTRDLMANILIESGIYPSFKMAFLHKDNSVHYKSQFDVSWMKTKSINIKSDISYQLEDYELITKGTIEMFSTIEQIKQMKMIWSTENRDNQFSNFIHLLHNTRNILQTSIKGFYEKEQDMFKMEFKGDATVLSSKSMKIANNLVYETSPVSIQHRFSIDHDTNSIYSHNIIATKKSLTMKILIPNSEFKTIELETKFNSDGKSFSEVDFIKIGDRFLFKLKKQSAIENKINGEMDFKSKLDFYSDYTSMKNFELNTEIKLKKESIKIQSQLKSESNNLATISIKGSHENRQIKYKLSIDSQFEIIRQLNLEFEKIYKDFDGSSNVDFDLAYNKILHFNSKITIRGIQLIKIDLLIKHRNYVKYLKLKHARHLLGYEHLLDSNMFGGKIKFTNTIISRGGMSLQTKLQTDFLIFKSLEIFGRFSKEKELKIIFQLPKDSEINGKIKLSFSNLNGLNKINFEMLSVLKAELKIDLKQMKKVELDFKLNSNGENYQIKFDFNCETKENSLKNFSQLKIVINERKFAIENKIEKVKSNYLLLESDIKTNLKIFNNYTFNFEYKLRPTKFSIDFKGIIDKKFIRLSTNLDSSSEIKIQLKIETSFSLLKEIDFELKQKQNSLLTQVSHKFRAIIKSNEHSFKFQNEIEWSGYNYVKVELMVDSKLSKNSYLIQPISLTFIHQFHRNILRENFQLNLSNDKNFKIQLEIPLNRKSKSLFELESSYQNFKQFSIDFNIDFSENEQKSISLKLLQNNEIFINSELKFKNENKLISFTGDLETKGNYKTGFLIELLENNFGTKIFKTKFTNSKLKEPMIFIGKLNLEKRELALSVTGTTDEQLSIYGQISKRQTVAKIKYGTHEFNFEVVLDKNIGIKLIQTTLSSIVNVNFEFIRSEKNFKLNGKYEKHYLKVICEFKGEIDIDFNIMEIISSVKLNLISSLTDGKYTIEGKTNLNEWKQFKTELNLYRSSQENKVKYYFNKENQEILNFNIEMKNAKSINVNYKSIFQLIKLGEFHLNYEKFPKTLYLKFTGDNAISKSINIEYNLDETSFKGKLSSPFEWFRKVSIEGELIKTTNEIKGKFNIDHNKLKQQIKGEFSIEMKFNLFKINLKTPFSFPYNEFSLKRETSDSITIIELADIENKILTYKFTSVSNAKFDIDLSLNIPKSLLDLSFNCKSNFDFENPTKKIKFSSTSNKFSDTKFDINFNFNQHEYKIQFFHPLKDGQFEFKISQFQESGKQIEITTQYGSIKHEVEIVYEIKNPNDIYFKSVAKCNSHYTSPASFEINYKHKFDIPSHFNIDSQFKFNEKTVFYNTISWKYQSDNSFNLLSKTILSPNTKEYECKFELTNKRGEILELMISAAEILQEDINIRLIRKEENFELTIKSPFELFKSININIRKEQKRNTWTQTLTCTTNTFGKYEMINEYKMLSNVDVELSNQINTPLVNRKFYTQVNLKNVENDQSINAQMEIDGKIYQVYLGRQNQQIKITFSSPIDYLNKIALKIKENLNTYEVEALYNQNEIKAILKKNQEIISLTLQSNTEYFKTVSVSIESSFTEKNTKLIKLTLNMNDKRVKMSFEIHPSWKYVQFTTENDLVNYLPKTFSGLIQYSLSPIDIVIELKSNEISLFNFILNKDQLLFNSKLKLHKTMTTEMKIYVTKSKIELILLNDKIFSVLIKKNPNKEINAQIIINNNQYSLNTIYDITDDKLIFKLSTYKNSVDKIIELNNEIDRKNQFLKLEINYLKDTILKFKLINENLPVRKISLELKVFSFNGVTDITVERKSSEINVKLAWNFLYNEEQLHIGSIIFALKSSSPINFLIIVNLKKSSYEAQLIEFDAGSYRLKISSPYKAFNIDVKWSYSNLIGIQEFRLSWKNSLTGDYNIKYNLKYHSDPSIKFLLSSSSPIIFFMSHFTTSKPYQISMDASLKIFNKDIINFDFNLKTKKLIELYFILRTPFTATRHIQISKNIKYTSIFEHEYETTVIYDGFMNIKYVSGHEIYLTKKIFKLKSSFHTNENQLVSVDINHFGNHNNLNHSFIWHVKDQKFGVRLDGGFRPLFEGKTEIYTPFHESGKIILMGKQMDKGIFFEAGNRNERLSSFEYSKDNEEQIIRITPPAKYGRPIGVKYSLRRSKRSSGSEMGTEVTYGTDKIFDLSSKIETKNNEYNALFNLQMPKLTEKSAELSLKHNYNDKTWNFDHQLKIKDNIFKVYRLFGNLFRENSKNFKVSLNTEHPDLGLMHLSFGHSLTPNNYNHHLLVKSNDKNWITHNGNVQYDFDKSKYSGELKTSSDSNSLSIGATHSGDWNKFLQSLLMKINDAVYLRYRGDLEPNENSQIKIEIGSSQINLIINNKEKRVELIYKNKTDKYNLEMINKRGKLESILTLNDKDLASLSIGYATIPLFINWKYLKHSGNIEMTLEKSLILLKMESSCMKYQKGLLKLTPNKIVTEINFMGKPYSMDAEYEYSPNKLLMKINTSIKSLSKINISITSSQIKIIFNEFYQSIDFKIAPHQIILISDNNFMFVKKISSELLIETPNKATWKLEIDSYSSLSKISFEQEKFIVSNKNNYFNIRSIEFEILNKIEKDLKHWQLILNTNNIQTLKFQIQIKDSQYSIGLESYLGQHLVVSFNMPIKELIISFKYKENYFNFIQQLQDNSNTNSKIIILKTKFESSVTYLHKINNEISYTVKDSSSYVKITLEMNKNAYSFSGELSNKKMIVNVMLNHFMYNINLTRISFSNFKLEFVTPSHQITMKVVKDVNIYNFDVNYDKKQIITILIKQNSDIGLLIDHDSIVEFYGQRIWNLKFNSDFKKHTIKMILPRKFDAIITNDWNENQMTKLGFQIKLDINGKPIELGAGINFLITSVSSSIEIQMENNYHVIKWKKTVTKTTEKQTTIGLLNKKTNNQWELIITSVKDKKFEIFWKTPSGIKEIKYYQEIVNNVRTAIDLDVFGKLKFNLKSNEKNSNKWSGTLSLFSIKIARIEVGKNIVEAFINEESTENKNVYLKWSKLEKGQWRKDYERTEQLIIVQKALNINVEIVEELIMKNTIYSSLTTIKYQLIDGSMKKFKYGGSLDITENNKIIIELLHPFLSIKTILIRSQPNKSILKYKMESYINGNSKISGYFLIKSDSNPGLSAQLNYNSQDESEYLHFHMKFIDDRQAETIIYTEKKQIRTTFFQLLVRLLNEHHIESTFQRKTYILSKFSETIKQYKSDLQMKYFDFQINQEKSIIKEVHSRYEQISNIIPHYSTFENQLSIFSREIREEMKSLSNEISEILKKNEFYFDTILKSTLKILVSKSSLMKTVKQIIFYFERVQINVLRIFEYFANELFLIQKHMKYCASIIAEIIVQPVINTINHYFFMYFPRFQKFIINKLETIKITFDQNLFKSLSISIQMKKLTKLFVLSNIYKMLSKTTEIIKYALSPFITGSFEFLKHEREIKLIYSNMIKILENLSGEILKNIDAIMNQFDENMNFITGDKFFQTLGNSVSAMSGYMIDQLKDEKNQKNVRAFIYSAIIYPFRDIQRKIEDLTMKIIWPSFVIISDIKNEQMNSYDEFKVIVKYTSPIPFHDFKSLPNFGYVTHKINNVKSIIKYTKQILESQFSTGYKYFEMKNWFIFYFPKPSFSILPEFENYATISKRSVLTFDKKSFTLNSDSCRVLLSKDIKLNKWEIIMNQQKNLQFYTINIGLNSVELSGSDYKVKLNGKSIELPIQFDSTSLVGLGRMIKLKDEKLGLTITVDPSNEIFTVGVSGWYHGKLQGLFGNSDNEPFNDFMLDNGKIVKSDVFMKAYNFKGQSCSIEEEGKLTVRPVKGCPFLRRLVCKFLYKCPFSPLASCFSKVDPKKFHEICVHSSDEFLMKLDPSVCDSARQYQAQCQKAGVEIPVPLPCQKCQVKNDKPLSINEFRHIKVKEKASDIIFIIDEGNCLNSLQHKLPNIVSELDKEMQTKGITSVNYGLVTFVDDYYNTANFHTVGQKLFGTSGELLKSLKLLQPSNGKYKDIVGAIKTASAYPFREHASRHIIMISCGTSKEYPVAIQTLSDVLKQKAIQFSLLTNFSFKLKNENKKSIIFGVDQKNIYTPLSRNGDKNLTTRPENDFLYQLTMKMKGVVFDYKFMTSNQQQERFVSSLANQISHRATPARSSKCTCVNDGEYNCVPLDTHTIFPVKRS